MAVSSSLYLHESDKAALQTLKAIPGFSQLLKTYMSIWNERYWHIINMSSNLRLSEKQMSKYYNMLPPICEKLGIDVPELYLELDVNPILIHTEIQNHLSLSRLDFWRRCRMN